MNSDLLMSHVWALQSIYAGLKLMQIAGVYSISGNLSFRAEYNGILLEDDYDIEISIPDDYPDRAPTVKETAGKIPKDFHTNYDYTLCLSAPLEIKMKFAQHKTLLGFVDKLLVPFLYGYSFKMKYGKMPFNELPHGTEGVIENYMSLFCVRDCRQVLGLLRVLHSNEQNSEKPCPCGSKLPLSKCHGKRLGAIKAHQSPGAYLKDALLIIEYIVKNRLSPRMAPQNPMV